MDAMHRIGRWLLPMTALALLAGCGFQLRQSAELPAGMPQIHLSVSGSADLADQLERELIQSGAQIVDKMGPGIAKLEVNARFSTRALTVSNYAKVSEFSVSYHSEFVVTDSDGNQLLAPQSVDMQREFTYDRTQALGTATREDQIRASLVTDMARAILRRLQATNQPDR